MESQKKRGKGKKKSISDIGAAHLASIISEATKKTKDNTDDEVDKPEKDNDHDDETATTIPGEDDDNRKLPPVDNRKRPPGEEEDDNRKLPPDDNRKLPPGDEDIKTLLPPSSDDQLNDKKLPPRGVKPEKPVTSSPDANTSSGVMETPSRPISNKLTKDPRSKTEIIYIIELISTVRAYHN